MEALYDNVYELGWGFHISHIFKKIKRVVKRVAKRVNKVVKKAANVTENLWAGALGAGVAAAQQYVDYYQQPYQQVQSQVHIVPRGAPTRGLPPLPEPPGGAGSSSGFSKYLPYIAIGGALLLLSRRN